MLAVYVLLQLLASPEYLLSFAGPVQAEAFGEEPPTHHFSVGERDLLHQYVFLHEQTCSNLANNAWLKMAETLDCNPVVGGLFRTMATTARPDTLCFRLARFNSF